MNFDISVKDSALVVSSSGCSVVPTEMAEEFQKRGIRVVALVSKAHLGASESKRDDGKKLSDFADLVLDTGAPAGDAMVKVEGLELPVSPGSTVGGCLIVNAIKAEVARLLTEAGKPPKALTANCVIGKERAGEIFEAAGGGSAFLVMVGMSLAGGGCAWRLRRCQQCTTNRHMRLHAYFPQGSSCWSGTA